MNRSVKYILLISTAIALINPASAHQWNEKKVIKHHGHKIVLVKHCKEHNHHKKCRVIRKIRKY